MRRFIFLMASFLLISCSRPEDSLWEQRVAELSTLAAETTYVAALDWNLAKMELSQDSLRHIALRDLGLYWEGTNALDTQSFIADSLLPRLTMQYLQSALLERFQHQPFDQFLSAWSTENWRHTQEQLLRSLLAKSHQAFPEPYMLDSLIGHTLHARDTSVARIPVGAFLVRHGADYWWAILVKWGEKAPALPDSLDAPMPRFEHLEGTLFRASDAQEMGKFFCD